MEKRNKSCKFTIKEEQDIINSYKNGLSLAKVGKQFGCDASTVKNILKVYNVPTRNLSQARRNFLKYTINEDCFSNINSADSAYWLGVMYSDGFITKANQYTNYFGLTIHEKDTEWLENFKEFLQYNGEIKHYIAKTAYSDNTPVARLLIGNNKIVSDLEKWGVIEQKTFKIKELPQTNFLDDFIRGYIDGDGALVKNILILLFQVQKTF